MPLFEAINSIASIFRHTSAISSYNSLFELGFAVNAAISTWATLRDKAQTEFKDQSERKIDEDIIASFELEPECATVGDLRTRVREEYDKLVKTVNTGASRARKIAILSAILLIIAGVYSTLHVWSWLAVTVSTLIVGWSPYLLYRWETKAEQATKKFNQELDQTKKILKDGQDSANKQPPSVPKTTESTK